jgi:kinetochore protein NDC80
VQSTAARGSVVSGRADPRNITDKRFIHASIRSLIDYLTMHNYDNSISPKILTNPSTKDFNNIVQFLFRQIDPNFAYTGKYEDEVISMYKCLKYPYSISKTSLNAVGSPHSWPQLLASVMWIIELLAYDEEALSGAAAEQDGEDPTASEKVFLTYLHSAYRCFLGGDDNTYGQLEEEFVDLFESRNNEDADEMKVFDVKNDGLSREIEELGERMTYLPELQEKKKVYAKDLGKFQNLIQELVKYKKELETKTSTRKVDLDRTTTTLANVDREVEELKQRIATQELSPEDVRRLSEEREHIESALGSAQEGRGALEQKVHEAEKLLRSKVLDLEDVMRTYRSLGEDLQLLPETARNAQGKDLALDIDTRAKKRADLVRCDIRGDVLPVLKSLRADLTDATNGLRDEYSLVAEEVEEVEGEIGELEERGVGLETRLQRAEELYRREREVHEAALASHTAEATDLEERLLACRDTGAEEGRVAAASRRVADARARRALLKDTHARQRKELMEGIMESVTKCADHREIIERKVGEVRELYSQRLESLLCMDQCSMSSSMFLSPAAAAAAAPSAASASAMATKMDITTDVSHSNNAIEEDQNVEDVNTSGYSLRSRDASAKKSRDSEKKGGSGGSTGKRDRRSLTAAGAGGGEGGRGSGGAVNHLNSLIDDAAEY